MELRISDCGFRNGKRDDEEICPTCHSVQSTIRHPQSEMACLSLVVLLVMLVACAKTGDPQPPLVLTPKPAADLAAREYGDQVVLTLSMPTENTNGTPVTTLKRIELFRRADKERANSAPLTTEAFIDGAGRIQSVESDEIPNYLHGKTLVFRDELVQPDRSQIYREAFRYSVVFVNKKGQSAGFSNQAFIAPVPIPPPPTGLSAEVFQDFVRLRWTAPQSNTDGSTPPRIAGYNVYRGEDPKKFLPAPLNDQPLQITEYEDRTFQFDQTYYYAVSVVGSRENPFAESTASVPIELKTRDTFPPDAPPRLELVLENGVVILLWMAPAAKDVQGYRIYRSQTGEAGRRLLRQELFTTLSYRDADVVKGKKLTYYVTAVDTHGNEGPAAEAAIEVP